MDFVPWAKIPRLKKGMVVTEKIDGTNAAIIVEQLGNLPNHPRLFEQYSDVDNPGRTTMSPIGGGKYCARLVGLDEHLWLVGAQSRNKLITPESDNAGFASWVFEHAEILAAMLGQGHHYGEWWGQGIQRRYGMEHKAFSLFNVNRYPTIIEGWQPALEAEGIAHQVRVVPELGRHAFSIDKIDEILADLARSGSAAAPGYMNPEGVVVYHAGAGTTFKAFVDPATEAAPKGGV